MQKNIYEIKKNGEMEINIISGVREIEFDINKYSYIFKSGHPNGHTLGFKQANKIANRRKCQ